MRKPLTSAALALLLAAGANALGTNQAEAAACRLDRDVIEQEAFIDQHEVGFNGPSFNESEAACEGDGGTGVISRDVLAQLTKKITDINATGEASIGRFGQYGIVLSQSAFVPAISDAGIMAFNNQQGVNLLGVPEHIELNIAIDGGSMESVGTHISHIGYGYSIEIDKSSGERLLFESNQELRTDVSGNPSLVDLRLDPSATKIDLGATLSEPSVGDALVTIPPSLHSLDLGMLEPGEVVSGRFGFDFGIDQGAEFGTLTGKFGDPLTLSGAPIFGTLSFEPVGTAVPEPSTLGLIATGLVGLAAFSRRRR